MPNIQLELPGMPARVQGPNEISVDNAMREAYTTFVRKNQQYGDSIDETGVLGATVECIAKMARLRELVLGNPQAGFQAQPEVRDTFLDLLNYAAIGMAMVDKSNWRGIEK